MLLCNNVSHWLGTSLESALLIYIIEPGHHSVRVPVVISHDTPASPELHNEGTLGWHLYHVATHVYGAIPMYCECPER